jgi:polysaccharide export outer membrane protein
MFFFTGDGHTLIENGIGTSVLSGSNGGNGANLNVRNQITYVVDEDGTIKLPVLGRIPIAGLSIREAESYLEQLYTQYYNEPFVVLQVNNNRVIVSPGDGGAAKVITLTNENTTLLEALALAGGISDRGISSKIKLIRVNDLTNERDVFLIDLSTIEGISKADLIVQPNDIIYVEPLPLIASGLVQEIAPIITLITTAALLIAIIQAQN